MEHTINPENILIPFRKDLKWGFCKADKTLVISCTYDKVRPFSGGLAAVMKIVPDFSTERTFYNEKWGLLNKSNELVLPCEYSTIEEFSEGLAAVCKEGLWGFVDTSGKWVISPKYKLVRPFANGLSYVHTNEGSGYIDTTGCEYFEDSIPVIKK